MVKMQQLDSNQKQIFSYDVTVGLLRGLKVHPKQSDNEVIIELIRYFKSGGKVNLRRD